LAAGFLKTHSRTHALLSPTDSRIPRILIPIQQCPFDFQSAPRRYAQVMFGSEIVSWNGIFADGNLIKIIGDSQCIQTRVEALLIENNVIDCDFPPQVYEDLIGLEANWGSNWHIPLEEYNNRRDFSDECVFTIDPLTARDLDDAVSIKLISSEPELYEAGVHIADVSYFVKEFTSVDFFARQRTTSVYLVDKVIPMLPRVLCEKLCSLNPGGPRLTFSVVWKITSDGEIKDVWFGRTIINSCVKLAYEHAQDIIDHNGDISWIEETKNMPPLCNDRYNYRHISDAVLRLHKIASHLRAKRFENGALRIDKVQLCFVLDPETGLPIGFSTPDRTPAKSLIEEFMLLANMAVAVKIYKHHPTIALLRRHPAPDAKMLGELKRFCEASNIDLDTSSSKGIEESLSKIRAGDTNRSKVLSQLLLKSMVAAQYFCSGSYGDTEKFHHYGLSVPFYTHFTSPIRRYPDIIVHRLLADSLGYGSTICEDTQSVSYLTMDCNTKKKAAKAISDGSMEIYYSAFVKNCGLLNAMAAVKLVQSDSIDVMLLDCGTTIRVYLDHGETKRELANHTFESYCGIRRLILEWHTADELGQLPVTSSGKKKKRARKRSNKSNNELPEDKSPETVLEASSAKSVNQSRSNDTTTAPVSDSIQQKCCGSEQSSGNLSAMASSSTNRLDPAKRIRQTIEVFDLVKVSLTVDQDDFTRLKL
ncbi:DIS3-like exonuclease 2, partial [Fragariocoptes setiger]